MIRKLEWLPSLWDPKIPFGRWIEWLVFSKLRGGRKVHDDVKLFFLEGNILEQINETTMVLMQKIARLVKVSEYRLTTITTSYTK